MAKPKEAEALPTFDGPVEASPVSGEGQWTLSRRYWSGVGVRKTLGLSYAFARRAAGNGSAPALAWLKARAETDPFGGLFLGLLYTEGPPAYRDKPRGDALLHAALQQLEPRAAKGDVDAAALLGLCYQRGIGTSKDAAKARSYIERAAAGQEPESLNVLGDLYYEGDGVAKDLAKAADLYRRSAEGGSSSGQSNYAYVLERGEGVKADGAAARGFYRQAAERGSPNAQHNLALLLMEGTPTAAQARDALDLLTRAAHQNDARAMLNLAQFYAQGGGVVAKDLPRAKELAARSAELGHERAKTWLSKLLEREKCEGGAETKLFDVAVSCADREALRRAIVTSGGKAQREDDRYWYDVYDSKGLLVDSVKLNVGYINAGDFAIAEYDFGEFVGDDVLERTIELLVPKYGAPKITKTVQQNLAKWMLRDGILIELERTPRNMYLRYVHPKRFKLLEQERAINNSEQRRREIAKQSRAF